MKKKNEVIESSLDKSEWVQLKTRVPRQLRSKIKAEAAELEKDMEVYVLDILTQRYGTLGNLRKTKELEDSKKK